MRLKPRKIYRIEKNQKKQIIKISHQIKNCCNSRKYETIQKKYFQCMDKCQNNQIFLNTLPFSNLINLIQSLTYIRISHNPMTTQISLHLLQQMKNKEDVSILKKTNKIQEEINFTLVVWNLQGMIPPTNSINMLMKQIIYSKKQKCPDLICVATQECQRTIGMSFFCQNKQDWENALKQSAEGYTLVASENLRALNTAILVRQDIANCFTIQSINLLRAGTCNILGNKGAISMVVNLFGQNFQFINCHLEAHQDQVNRRNQILLKIANEVANRDHRNEVFICGDLNYRIDMTHEEYYKFVKNKKNTDQTMKYSAMLERDQLTQQQILRQRFLPFYKQMPIQFPPTYKLSDNNQQYDKKRIPGWTDRIFHRKGRTRQLKYFCLYDLLGTDHRPVVAEYQIETEQTLSIFPDQYVQVKTRDKCNLI